jgi:transcriptional regulator with XRE-family HTH domain
MAERKSRPRNNRKHSQAELGALLADLRKAKGFSLREVEDATDEALMEKAGYLMPSEDGGGRRKRLAAFAIDDLTAEEEEELLKYLAFLRSRGSS